MLHECLGDPNLKLPCRLQEVKDQADHHKVDQAMTDQEDHHKVDQPDKAVTVPVDQADHKVTVTKDPNAPRDLMLSARPVPENAPMPETKHLCAWFVAWSD